MPEAEWLNRTICIDTGCVFGGKLTALRYPELELVSVPALRAYAQSKKPFLSPGSECPEFGERVAEQVYQPRPGAYALIRDEAGRVAVLQTPKGYCLPGGGAEPGETPEQTLLREVREECGQSVRVLEKIGEAVQYVFAPDEGYFAKQCVFFEAVFDGPGGKAAEPDHTLRWLNLEETAQCLRHESQAWAVRRWAAGRPLSLQQQHDDMLDLADLLGKRIVSTRLHGNITVREENGVAALEVLSRFAVNPKWLIYLPPTMSPCETSQRPDLLEHPAEAFAYFRHAGVPRVICEEKHMGSRAVVVVCRSEDAARKRFGVLDEGIGICYTRTGRRFFDDRAREAEFLERIRAALDKTAFWDEFKSDWVCLDCELMPWSAKAQELLRQQYAAVGAASRAALQEAVETLQCATANSAAVAELLQSYTDRAVAASQYIAAYRRYCWPVRTLTDLKLAPFHLLATENAVHVNRDHVWHMETLAKICRADAEMLLATPYRIVDVTDPADEAEGIRWWEELTEKGGEGMVVKPLDFVAKGRRGLAQPAVKCRGREYLRIIYGPEYTAAAHLERLRQRGLGAKRSLALREFSLGIEALERFVRGEPLRRVHECVFGVLALESEPVDPRL